MKVYRMSKDFLLVCGYETNFYIYKNIASAIVAFDCYLRLVSFLSRINSRDQVGLFEHHDFLNK